LAHDLEDIGDGAPASSALFLQPDMPLVRIRQRGRRFMGLSHDHDNLLDVIGRAYEGVDHVFMDGVRETMLDSAESDDEPRCSGPRLQATSPSVVLNSTPSASAVDPVVARDGQRPYEM
jgi:hypothetical protein